MDSTIEISVKLIRDKYELEHVKSHQDDKIDFDKLPFAAQLNVLCDKMATNQLKRQRVQTELKLVRSLFGISRLKYGMALKLSHHTLLHAYVIALLCPNIEITYRRNFS